MIDDTHYSAAWWTTVVEPGDADVHALRAALGDEEAWRWARAPAPSPLPPALAGHDWEAAWGRWHPRAAADALDAELERADRIGAAFLTPSDPQWPEGMADLGPRAPVGLWARGRLDPRGSATRASISIVGARACTREGQNEAANMACALTEKGYRTVSGGAYGIDIAVHRGALAAPGPTTVVFAGGVGAPYPRAHAEDFRAVMDAGGAVVSEAPPSWRPAKWRFLARNRLIAAWSGSTVVVEAGMRSGALSTARAAMELGRNVGAVPGSVRAPMSAGALALIRNGATLVRDAADVEEMHAPIGSCAPEPLFGAPVEEDRGADALAPAQRRVWEALPARSRARLGAVVTASGLSERDVLVALAGLELAGMVSSDTTGWKRMPAVARR